MEFGQGEGDYEPWKDEEAEVEIQPKKKSRSSTPGWAKFNVDRSEKKRLENDMKKINQGIPTRRVRGKHSFRSSTRSIYHNVKRIDDDEDWTRPEMVDASTQTNDYDSEPDDVVQDEDDGKSNGSFSVGQYMA